LVVPAWPGSAAALRRAGAGARRPAFTVALPVPRGGGCSPPGRRV